LINLRTLAIDTSSAACSVALFEGDRLVDSAHQVIGRGHAEQLLVMIAALDGGGRADRIWVGCGPGSFTGVRVGLAAALALGIGWQVPVSGFGSLALVAAAARTGTKVLVAMEGGHGEYFVQDFADDGSAMGPARSLPPETAAQADTIDVAGSRAATLVERRGSGLAHAHYPDARFALGITPSECGWPARPVYGRAPDAVATAR
jgi:tRNA threonylcarbamoyladenosine biosynthesis protein TsaB